LKCKHAVDLIDFAGHDLLGSQKSEAVSWVGIPGGSNLHEVAPRQAGDAHAIGLVFAQQGVGVLVDGALPGAVRVGDVDA
jgi:hypothetical protein